MKFNLLITLAAMWLGVAGCASSEYETNNARPPEQIPFGEPPAPIMLAHADPEPSHVNPHDAGDYARIERDSQASRFDHTPLDPSAEAEYDENPPGPGPEVDDVGDFEEPLSEYGRWIETPEYGRVWQPYNVGNEWRPYASDGRWIHTEYGWYWESYEPWGWACYHYGNWVYTPYCGWAWVPGVVWSPAWVVWRESDEYVAWAPVPPPHCPTYYPAYEYCAPGIRYVDFVFVTWFDFCEPIHFKHGRHHGHHYKVIHKTKNVTNIKVKNKNVVVNEGPDVRQVEKITRTKAPSRKLGDKEFDQNFSRPLVVKTKPNSSAESEFTDRRRFDFKTRAAKSAASFSHAPKAATATDMRRQPARFDSPLGVKVDKFTEVAPRPQPARRQKTDYSSSGWFDPGNKKRQKSAESFAPSAAAFTPSKPAVRSERVKPVKNTARFEERNEQQSKQRYKPAIPSRTKYESRQQKNRVQPGASFDRKSPSQPSRVSKQEVRAARSYDSYKKNDSRPAKVSSESSDKRRFDAPSAKKNRD